MKFRSLVIAAATALVPTVAGAEWREVETAHFLIISESPPAQIEKLAERLESYDKLMRMATRIAEDNPVKVRIYEVAGTDSIERALGLVDSGVAGFYDSNALGPYAVTPRKTMNSGRYFTPALVLHHEYAHHFMLQYLPSIYPSWYIEGFAELIGSSQMLEDGRIGYGMPAKHRGDDIATNWVSLDELLTKEKVTYLDTYGQGWALTHFLTFDKKRADLLRQYLAAITSGKNFKEASGVFGDLAALNREARSYIKSGGFDYRPVKVEIQAPVIKRTRSEAATDRLLALLPTHVRGLARKSILLSQAASKLSGDARSAKVKEAQGFAVKANRADQAEPLPLLAYYQSFNLTGETPPALAVEGLATVVDMVPRDTAARQLLVDQLARDKRFDAAIATLMPMANSPHDSPRREAAREQMEKLKAIKAGTALASVPS